jgi:hypothetical protein
MCASFDSTLPESQMRSLSRAHEAASLDALTTDRASEAVRVDVPLGLWRA